MRRRTPRGAALHVRFYEKSDCGLCGEAYRALTRVRMEMPLDIERIDIEHDPGLVDRYAIRVPVIAVGPNELDVAGLEEPALRRWLAERA